MQKVIVKCSETQEEADELDFILWDVLWRPLDFPRDIRRSFGMEKDSREIVAVEHGAIIGGSVVYRHDKEKIEIRHIAIKKEHQDRGIGGRLIKFIEEYAGSQGCKQIRVIARNTSEAFFLKNEFSVLPEDVPSHPSFSKHGISFVVMGKMLIFKECQ